MSLEKETARSVVISPEAIEKRRQELNKQKQDAIQEQSPIDVDETEQARDVSEVEKRKPDPTTEVVAEEVKKEEVSKPEEVSFKSPRERIGTPIIVPKSKIQINIDEEGRFSSATKATKRTGAVEKEVSIPSRKKAVQNIIEEV